MIIDGEEFNISPAVWDVFADWYGDKAYRQAGAVEAMEAAARRAVVEDLAASGYIQAAGWVAGGIAKL